MPIAALVAISCVLSAFSTVHAQVIYTTADSTYSQSFDSLPVNNTTNSTTVFTFNNNSTLTGWYASAPAVGQTSKSASSSGSGKATDLGLYAWGAAGGTDRSLGTYTVSVSSGLTSPSYIGVQIQNTSGTTLDYATITYNVEEWRRNTDASSLTLEYLVTSATGNVLTTGSFTSLSGTTVNAVTGSPSGGTGFAPIGGTTSVSTLLSGLAWNSGDYLWLRWANVGPSQSDTTAAALSVDDFTFVGSTVPEPVTSFMLLLGCGSLLLLNRKRRLA